MNKASGSDGILAELFQILKDDAVKLLHSIFQQIWKIQEWPQDWKRSVFIPITKKDNAKEFSNCHTIALISHASKVMLKIFQTRLQQYNIYCINRACYNFQLPTNCIISNTSFMIWLDKIMSWLVQLYLII